MGGAVRPQWRSAGPRPDAPAEAAGRGDVSSALCAAPSPPDRRGPRGQLLLCVWEMRCHFRNYTQLFIIRGRVPAGWAGAGWGTGTNPRSTFIPFWMSVWSPEIPGN